MAESEIKLLAYQIQELVKKQDSLCNELNELFDKMDKRVGKVEMRIAWIYGLLAGLGVVSISSLIKMFL